jgi:disulfide bond formation protein DsbB
MKYTQASVFALFVLLAAGALGFALVQQYAFGLPPCEFCIWQRWPWGLVLVLGAFGGVLAPRRATRPLLLLIAALLLAGAVIALFHVGVEEHWWQGFTSCSSAAPPAGSIEALRAQLQAAPIVRCDQAAWRLFGISMAGYNFAVSAAAAILAFAIARRGFGEQA